MASTGVRSLTAVVISRAAALSSWLLGLGFGIPGIYAAEYLDRTGGIMRLMGFPTYGPGVFGDFGVPTTVTLILAFVAVCAAECVIGVLLWLRRTMRLGWILALVLLPFELVFWIGFELPFGPLLGVIRTGLVITAWVAERRSARGGA